MKQNGVDSWSSPRDKRMVRIVGGCSKMCFLFREGGQLSPMVMTVWKIMAFCNLRQPLWPNRQRAGRLIKRMWIRVPSAVFIRVQACRNMLRALQGCKTTNREINTRIFSRLRTTTAWCSTHMAVWQSHPQRGARTHDREIKSLMLYRLS